jgi:hypothetical protein
MKRKRPTQAKIDEMQRWADECVAGVRQSLAKDNAETVFEIASHTARRLFEHPDLMPEFIQDLETRRLDKRETHWANNVICLFLALHSEHDPSLPQPLGKYGAELLRRAVKENIRGSLELRDNYIADMLARLKKWDISLFPNRAGRRPGQTYGCDIVVKAFKKAGINDITSSIVENAKNNWSRSRRP